MSLRRAGYLLAVSLVSGFLACPALVLAWGLVYWPDQDLAVQWSQAYTWIKMADVIPLWGAALSVGLLREQTWRREWLLCLPVSLLWGGVYLLFLTLPRGYTWLYWPLTIPFGLAGLISLGLLGRAGGR